jgi:hypothetical protein
MVVTSMFCHLRTNRRESGLLRGIDRKEYCYAEHDSITQSPDHLQVSGSTK